MILFEFDRLAEQMNPIFANYKWDDKVYYGVFLTQVFHYVKHSSRIMAVAAGMMPQEKEGVHVQLLRHAAEEKGHQFLAKNDLRAIGFGLDSFPIHHATRLFYESQYYKVMCVNPVSFYGYALALEGLAIKKMKGLYENCRQAHGDAACSFIRVHAQEDERHVDEAVKLMEALPGPDKKDLILNLQQSMYTISLMLKESAEFAAGAWQTKKVS